MDRIVPRRTSCTVADARIRGQGVLHTELNQFVSKSHD